MNFNSRDLKVLVVEDNQHFRLLIRTVLQALGVQNIVEAKDGGDALEQMKSTRVDLVVADWKMSPMDGIEFARKLRTAPDSPDPFVPIIMVSGYAEAHLITLAREVGINEFLAKPISAKTLMARVLSVLERPRPFVRADSYFGPDRRRRQLTYNGPERRKPKSGQ